MNSFTAIRKMNFYGRKKIPFLFIIDFEIRKPIILPLAEIKSDEILYDINGLKNYDPVSLRGVPKGRRSNLGVKVEIATVAFGDLAMTKVVSGTSVTKNYDGNLKTEDKKIVFRKYPVTFRKYKKAFDKIQKYFYEGHSYLVNLTFPTRVETNLTFKEIFFNSTAKYKLVFVPHQRGKNYPEARISGISGSTNDLVVFSPETFVKIKNGKIYSYPMKGTIDAAIDGAARKIISDKKEFAEHLTIVDLIRNDLGIVAKNVKVKRFRYVEKIITHNNELLQVSSEIVGDLQKNYYERIGDVVFSLLPAGSISGAPKKKTVEIIKEVENYERGYYTGIFGIFDGQNLDSAVMIRYLEKIGNKIFYKSGGGITTYSDVQSEYKELIDKVYVPIVE
ncbi:MAG: aminodeoxychorismate synthase component I [Elusimicrobiota bacterium]